MIFERAFEGQTAVVTGGTRGIGRGIALALLERGARVHVTWTGNDAAARAFEDECARFDGRAKLHRFDVADASACEAFWSALEASEADGVQMLVNNAGIRRDALVGTQKAEDWERVLDVNLSGAFHMSKLALRVMLPRRYGRIVFVTSPAARFGFQGQASYSASKAGLQGLMRSLAREVAKRKITVNCVSPGFVDTELLGDLSDDAKKEHLAMVPMQRFGTIDEVAYATLCLLAREASYVHGTTLEVTGGL